MKLLNLVLKQQKFVLQETENCALNEVLLQTINSVTTHAHLTLQTLPD